MNFVHPPLEGSKVCSLAARPVHGLLYGYSLAYEEVRPQIAQALGYSKSTTYNALGELRRTGLLGVHERRGVIIGASRTDTRDLRRCKGAS